MHSACIPRADICTAPQGAAEIAASLTATGQWESLTTLDVTYEVDEDDYASIAYFSGVQCAVYSLGNLSSGCNATVTSAYILDEYHWLYYHYDEDYGDADANGLGPGVVLPSVRRGSFEDVVVGLQPERIYNFRLGNDGTQACTMTFTLRTYLPGSAGGAPHLCLHTCTFLPRHICEALSQIGLQRG